MQLYIDLGTNGFITDPLFKAPLGELSFKRGDSSVVNLAFVSGNTPLSAVSGKTIKFGIKQAGDYDGPYLVYTDEYTTAGTNYVVKPSFNTTTLNNLLSGDTPSVASMLEVTWSDNGVDEFSSNTQAVTINNDVNKVGEAPPYIIPEPVQWMAENVIGLGTTPYDAYIHTTDPDLPRPLFQYDSNYWTSNGDDDSLGSLWWFTLNYEVSEGFWYLYLYNLGTIYETWTSPTANGVYTPIGSTGLGDMYITMINEDILNKHRFVTDTKDSLFVNIGTSLSGVSANWKSIAINDLILPYVP